VDITLRAVTGDEIEAFQRATSVAFGVVASPDDSEQWGTGLEPERTIAAFDGDAIVGTAAAFSFELTVPGGALVPTAGVTMVGVHPTHRRRGLLVRMMDRQLRDVAERGEPLAVLIASESVIYGRFGYGAAAFATSWSLATEGTELASPSTADGRLRLLDVKEATAVVPGVYDRARQRQVGEVTRGTAAWENDFQRPGGKGPRPIFTVVHESPTGIPDGFARYRIRDDWSSGIAAHTLEVNDLYAYDDDAEAALWEFLLAVDLVGVVKASGRPVDEPLRWRLADPRRLQVHQLTDHLWVRVLDPVDALARRTYAGDDRLVIELDDPFRPENTGRFEVTGSPSGAEAARTSAAPDLAMTVRELGALYLGGVSATTLARAGRVAELTRGALARADRFFCVSPAPWCGTHF